MGLEKVDFKWAAGRRTIQGVDPVSSAGVNIYKKYLCTAPLPLIIFNIVDFNWAVVSTTAQYLIAKISLYSIGLGFTLSGQQGEGQSQVLTWSASGACVIPDIKGGHRKKIYLRIWKSK